MYMLKSVGDSLMYFAMYLIMVRGMFVWCSLCVCVCVCLLCLMFCSCLVRSGGLF